MGVHNLYRNEAGRQILFSDHFVEHPRYRGTRTSLKNDVALIKLPNDGATFSGITGFVFLVPPLEQFCLGRCNFGRIDR